MKVRYIGDYYKVYLRKGEVYDAEYFDGFYKTRWTTSKQRLPISAGQHEALH